MEREEKLPRGIYRRGEMLYVTFALADGTIERRSVGRAPVKEAERRRLNWMHEVAMGTYQKKQPRQTIFTVKDLWDAYLIDYKNRSGKDAGRLEIAWNHLKETFEHKRAGDLTTSQINKYIEERREGITDEEAKLKRNGTVNREVALLRSLFYYGKRGVSPAMVEDIPAFPKRLKESPPREGFVDDHDFDVLVTNTKSLWMRTAIEVAYNFGLRKGELFGLQVKNLDLNLGPEGGWIHLRKTKNGRLRKAKMTPLIFTLLTECCRDKKPTDYVFTREDGSHVVDPRDDWYTLCVQSRLGEYVRAKRGNGKEFDKYVGLQLHDFRRSAVRNMIRRGVSEKTAMLISGHVTRSMLDRYNIGDERDLEEATRKIEAGRVKCTNSDTATLAASQAVDIDVRKSLN
jgi:integrase